MRRNISLDRLKSTFRLLFVSDVPLISSKQIFLTLLDGGGGRHQPRSDDYPLTVRNKALLLVILKPHCQFFSLSNNTPRNKTVVYFKIIQ